MRTNAMNNTVGFYFYKVLSGCTQLLVLTCVSIACIATAYAQATTQVTTRGLSPASNTYRSFVDSSIVRDSRLNQPLDLLNDFYPAIEVTIAKHDNVRRRSDVQEDDLLIVAAPSLGYRTDIGRHSFYAAYSGVFTFHDELSEEDAQSNNVFARLGLDISRRWDATLLGGFGRSFEERGVSGSRPFNRFIADVETGPDEIGHGFYGIDVIYGQNVSPLVGVLGYEKHITSYKNNFQGADDNPTGGRDRDTESLHLDLSYRFMPKTSVFGRIERQEINYDRSLNNLDSEQTDFLLGLRWSPTNTLSGVVGLGQSDRDFDDPLRSGYSGSTYYANLGYMINPFSNVHFSASKSLEEPGDDMSDFYVSELIGIGWDHAITPELVFSIFAKWIDDDYQADREEQFFDYGLALDYAWKPWLSAGLYYGEIERDSTLDDVAYEDRYFGIRLRSDLRSLLRGRRSWVVEPDSFEYPRKAESR